MRAGAFSVGTPLSALRRREIYINQVDGVKTELLKAI